jgi:hypothetical protein
MVSRAAKGDPIPVGSPIAGREIRIVMDGTDPFAIGKPNVRLVKLLLRARRFNAALPQGEGIAFAALQWFAASHALTCKTNNRATAHYMHTP